MFNLFRKKFPAATSAFARPESATANAPNSELVRVTIAAIKDQGPIVGALFLVAYENVYPYFPSFQRAMEEDQLFAPTIEGMADFHLAEYAKRMGTSEADEVGRRRFHYFYIATLLKTLQKRAKNDESLWNDIVEIWVAVLPGARAIRSTLDKTSLWRAEHIDVFASIKNEDEGEWYCLHMLVPKEIRYHRRIQDWLERDLTPEQRALMDETCNVFDTDKPKT